MATTIDVVRYERTLLLTAIQYECTRVYVVDWTEQHGYRLDFCYMCFPFQDRRVAFKFAREKNSHVMIFNFRRLIDMDDGEFYCIGKQSPNRELAIELRNKNRLKSKKEVLYAVR